MFFFSCHSAPDSSDKVYTCTNIPFVMIVNIVPHSFCSFSRREVKEKPWQLRGGNDDDGDDNAQGIVTLEDVDRDQ